MQGLRGGLMVCGTTSDAGKSTVVAGLCRLLARQGVSVAPFKAQNMALNSAVTATGHEIGRAQYLQAVAAGVEPEVAMNPILLKPTADRTSQVVVQGRSIGTMTAAEYHEHKPELLTMVLDALADLRGRFDVVLCEGAGSPTEINLLAHDIVNLRIAREAALPAIVVGDIDRGGVFASLYGTVALLPPDLRALVHGFVINKFRGDPSLLFDGPAVLETASGVPTIGILPMLDALNLDAEDSLSLERGWPTPMGAPPSVLDVAVIAFPRLSNVTDMDPLAAEPGVSVRLVRDARSLGRPHLVVLPGTKATVADLAWLRARHLDTAISASGATVLGICGGYQMLGRAIDDPVESGDGAVPGLGWLPVTTQFEPDKVLRRDHGSALGAALHGYQIHHGRVHPDPSTDRAVQWLKFAGQTDGVAVVDPSSRTGAIYGTTVHGLFEADGFRRRFLEQVAAAHGVTLPTASLCFATHRTAQLDRVADALETHLDMSRLVELIETAR
jgi:adenosylcobyric acid synthase